MSMEVGLDDENNEGYSEGETVVASLAVGTNEGYLVAYIVGVCDD